MTRTLPLLMLLPLAVLPWLAQDGSAQAPGSPAATAFPTPAAEACRALVLPAALEGAVQTPQAAAPFRIANGTITPLAGFSVAARVLARQDYSSDLQAAWSPTDLALGWGPMSEPGMAERLEVRQQDRWYRYRWGREGPPMAPGEIVRNSANMHMVPADAAVVQALSRVQAGDLVRIDGWLVRIDGDGGERWESSLTREDTGVGGCELVLVCRLQRK